MTEVCAIGRLSHVMLPCLWDRFLQRDSLNFNALCSKSVSSFYLRGWFEQPVIQSSGYPCFLSVRPPLSLCISLSPSWSEFDSQAFSFQHAEVLMGGQSTSSTPTVIPAEFGRIDSRKVILLCVCVCLSIGECASLYSVQKSLAQGLKKWIAGWNYSLEKKIYIWFVWSGWIKQ